MKHFILFLLLINASATLFAQQTESVEHKLTHATIYTNRAMLTREASLDLQKGAYVIRFDRIPDNMDLRSIRVIDPKNPNVVINGISWERVVSKEIDNQHLSKLEKEQLKFSEMITEKRNYIEMLNIRETLIKTYTSQLSKAIDEQSYKNTDSSTKSTWETALNYKLFESLSIADSLAKLNVDITELQTQLQQTNRELSKYFSQDIRRSHIGLSVSLVVNSAVKFPLQISYLTHSASWNPLYSARLYEGNKKLEFGYNGVIFQSTGERWENVTLVLSTAQPQISAMPPTPIKTVLIGRTLNPNETYEYANKQGTAVVEEAEAIGGVLNAYASDFSSISQEGPAVTFKINGVHTVLSADQPTQVVITQNHTHVHVINECIPTMRQGVYMKAQLKNNTPYPILPGVVDLYRNTGYIGTTSFVYAAPGSPLEFFAGMVNNVGTSYIKPTEFSRVIGAFSTTEEHFFANQTTTLINNTDQALTICVKMQVPVSELEEVSVQIIRQKMTVNSENEVVFPTTPNEQLDKKNGIISWNVTLKPMTKENVLLSYKVSKPFKSKLKRSL